MTKSPKVDRSLKLFFYGPGTGESIAVCLPDGRWGLLDCYIRSKEKGTGVLQFLTERKVENLAFFCLTHPHADHYLGSERILERYAGKIEQIWQWDGLSGNEIQTKAIMAAMLRSDLEEDPEGERLAKGFRAVLKAIDKARRRGVYRRVAAPLTLLELAEYKITAVRPDNNLIEDVENKILSMIVKDGFLLFNEEEGSLLNSLSIVLLLEFGDARILFLGDAEGANESLHSSNKQSCAIKVAHHGSRNGLGAEGFRCPPRTKASISCLVITPYIRSGLPRADMIERYRNVARELILTGPSVTAPQTIEPTLPKGRVVDGPGTWHGIEIFPNGEVRRCT